MTEFMPRSVEDRRHFMLRMADRLGDKAWDLIRMQAITVKVKPDGSRVTTADTELNAYFNEAVQATFPQDFVRGEEASVAPAGLDSQEFTPDSGRGLWTIDPIDKTNNFWRGYETGHFADSNATIQIAWFAPGSQTPEISTILAPFNELPSQLMADPSGAYYRTGAARTLRPIRVPEGPTRLRDVARYDANYWLGVDPRFEHIETMLPYARRINHPTAYAAVALGDIDLGIFPGTHPHDVAPNAHVVHQAGGSVRTLDGTSYEETDWRMEPVNGLVAANNDELSADFLDMLNHTV